MSGPVDVLAVLGGVVYALQSTAVADDVREARAAVAELIEALREFTNDDRLRYRPMMVRLHAAIARVGGAE